MVTPPFPLAFIDEHDFSTLSSSTLYKTYGTLLEKALKHTERFFLSDEQLLTAEKEQMAAQVLKLNESCQAIILRIDALHSMQRLPWLDLSASGFPNFHEIQTLSILAKESKSITKQNRCSKTLRRIMLQQIFRGEQVECETLRLITETEFLEDLCNKEIFLPMTKESVIAEKVKHETDLSFNWGCYDASLNRPLMNTLKIHVKGPDDPQMIDHIWSILKTNATRDQDFRVLKTTLQNQLKPAVIKNLKRYSLGPFYAPAVLQSKVKSTVDIIEIDLMDLFDKFGYRTQWFALLMKKESYTESHGQAGSYLPPSQYILAPHALLTLLQANSQGKFNWFTELNLLPC